jgi:hypothetical protein
VDEIANIFRGIDDHFVAAFRHPEAEWYGAS